MALPAEMPADLHAAIQSFCDKDPEALKLLDVLKVTEVLALSLRDLFSHSDTPIYSSAVMMAAYLRKAQERLHKVRPSDLREHHLPNAHDDLKAIVAHTEEATGRIMEVAEALLAMEPDDGNYFESVNDYVMQIFEACSFQDITGQRVSRVTESIDATREQVDALSDVLGTTHDESVTPAAQTERDKWREDNLLHGPQDQDEALDQGDVDEVISQDDIDSLFD